MAQAQWASAIEEEAALLREHQKALELQLLEHAQEVTGLRQGLPDGAAQIIGRHRDLASRSEDLVGRVAELEAQRESDASRRQMLERQLVQVWPYLLLSLSLAHTDRGSAIPLMQFLPLLAQAMMQEAQHRKRTADMEEQLCRSLGPSVHEGAPPTVAHDDSNLVEELQAQLRMVSRLGQAVRLSNVPSLKRHWCG